MSNTANVVYVDKKTEEEITRKQSEDFEKKAIPLQHEGYKFGNKKDMADFSNMKRATMVISGDSVNRAGRKPNISHAMFFVSNNDTEYDTIHFAIPIDTSEEKRKELSVLFPSIAVLEHRDTGQYLVHITLDEEDAPGTETVLSNNVYKLESLGIKTEPYPFTSVAIQSMPPFMDSYNAVLELSNDYVSFDDIPVSDNLKTMLDSFGNSHDVFSYPRNIQNKLDSILSERVGTRIEQENRPSIRPR